MTGQFWHDLESALFWSDCETELRQMPILNINRCADIPDDWPYLMGVPMTILDRPDVHDVYEIVWMVRWHVCGKCKYCRIIVRLREPSRDRDMRDIIADNEVFDESPREDWFEEHADYLNELDLEGGCYPICYPTVSVRL